MLSLFPELLDWSWYAPFFFRMFIGIYVINVGLLAARTNNQPKDRDDIAWTLLAALLFVLGASFLAGIYIQLAGAIGFALALVAIYCKLKNLPLVLVEESPKFYFLIGLVSLSFVILGAGPYAFDLPL